MVVAIPKSKILVDQPKPEEWSMPDGRQITHQALCKMGCTSGDIDRIMQEFYRDPSPDAFQNFSLKGVELIKEHKVGSANESVFDEQRHEQAQFDENKRLEEQRMLAAKQQEEEFFKKKAAEEKYAREQRPQEEAANNRIMGLPLGLATFGLGLGLTAGALSDVGGQVGGMTQSANSPMMVASNSGGVMLSGLRSVLGMEGPGADKDFLLKGPNQTVAFTPGVPEAKPDALAPDTPARKQAMAMGMNGMSLTPPGMGMV